MDAESVKEMVANDMLHIEPFVEIEEKRALTPIIEENTHSIETQTDAVAPAVAAVVEPVIAAATADIARQPAQLAVPHGPATQAHHREPRLGSHAK